MHLTLLPMVKEVIAEQSRNTSSPIVVTELGMVTEVRPEHQANAWSPMVLMELGMVTEVRPEQSRFLLCIDYQKKCTHKGRKVILRILEEFELLSLLTFLTKIKQSRILYIEVLCIIC